MRKVAQGNEGSLCGFAYGTQIAQIGRGSNLLAIWSCLKFLFKNKVNGCSLCLLLFVEYVEYVNSPSVQKALSI